jgi:hypothetical protein
VNGPQPASVNLADTFPKKVADQLKVLEVRAIATILAMRGPEHQLDNLAKHGNRLGLNNPLQTTKGKLTSKDVKVVDQAKNVARQICQAAHLADPMKAVANVQ